MSDELIGSKHENVKGTFQLFDSVPFLLSVSLNPFHVTELF